MPVILRHEGYRFFFFSNERGEPVHVRKAEKVAKFWVEPQIALAESYELTSAELSRLARVVEQNRELILRSWHEHFGQ